MVEKLKKKKRESISVFSKPMFPSLSLALFTHGEIENFSTIFPRALYVSIPVE